MCNCTSRGRRKVLLVEDGIEFHELAILYLSEHCELFIAASIEEAVDTLGAEPNIEIVILDGSVPIYKGDTETISTIRLAQIIQQIFGESVTLFAASASDESNQKLVSCGAMPTDKISVYPAVRKRLSDCACF